MKAPEGLKATQKMLENVLKSPWFWICVAIVVAFIVRANWNRWWGQLTRTDRGNYDQDARNAELQQMARDAYTVINATLIFGGVTPTGREATLEKLLHVNDSELRYIADFYKDINADGTSLSEDLTNEAMPFSNVKDQLLSKLTQLNL